MASTLEFPLIPKRGSKLIVLVITRISTTKQDVRSLADQLQKCKEYLKLHCKPEIDYKVISSQGSGEHLDRKELLEAEDMVASGNLDLVIVEDLGRICRRHHALAFCELCLDSDCRLIAINDRVDTAGEGWQDSAFISSWHHERSNRDTSNRIRRSLRSRFEKGEVFQCEIFGYIKPPNAKNDGDVSKDPAAEPIYDHWFQLLEDGANYAEVSDWLNEKNVPTGPYARQKHWDSKMVSRITRNPILKGVRVRNRMITKRVNKTGRHKAVKA